MSGFAAHGNHQIVTKEILLHFPNSGIFETVNGSHIMTTEAVKTEVHKCAEHVSDSGKWGAFYQHSCKKPGKVVRLTNSADRLPGPRGFDMSDKISYKWYCGTHDPVARRERQDKKEAEYRAERATKNAALVNSAARQALVNRVVGHLTNEQLADLEVFLKTSVFCKG